MPTTPIVYTPLDVAEKLQIGRTKVFALLKSGELPSVLIGRQRRVLPEQLDAFMEKLRAETDVSGEDERLGGWPEDLPQPTRQSIAAPRRRARRTKGTAAAK